MRDREVHDSIVGNIERLLGNRSWRWLARESGVAASTLHDQKGSKFTVAILMRLAAALNVPLPELLPSPPVTRDSMDDPDSRDAAIRPAS